MAVGMAGGAVPSSAAATAGVASQCRSDGGTGGTHLLEPSAMQEESNCGLAHEGTIKTMPRLAKSRPSDRAARRKLLEGKIREAQARVFVSTLQPLFHGKCCLLGLLAVEIVRIAAWWQGTVPGWSVFGMHFLTTASDLACLLCASPLFLFGVQGQCVSLGCLGPMLTLVFAMCLVDLSALGAYLVVATPRPLSPGERSLFDCLEAIAGAWEFALVASVSLQVSLCASSWKVYKELRVVGLYPPGSDPTTIGQHREVSILEVMCEAEDVELLADCEMGCDSIGFSLCAEKPVVVNQVSSQAKPAAAVSSVVMQAPAAGAYPAAAATSGRAPRGSPSHREEANEAKAQAQPLLAAGGGDAADPRWPDGLFAAGTIADTGSMAGI